MSDLPAGPSTSYTCLACRVGFSNGDAQRTHYKTDWHRYNLKRKIANMPPITAQAFRERVLAQKDEEARTATVQTFSANCEACGKSFASENTYQTHVSSKKHKEAEEAFNKKKAAKTAQQSAQPEGASPESDVAQAAGKRTQPKTQEERLEERARRLQLEGKTPAAEPIPAAAPVPEGGDAAAASGAPEYVPEDPVLMPEDCLFCQHRAESLEANVSHMTSAHGFFIPNLEYLVDLPGLIEYLQVKVGNLYMCLKCNDHGKVFTSIEAVRGHMASKGHMQVDYSEDGALEIGEYYDFSSTYPDNDQLTDEQREMQLVPADNKAHAIVVKDYEVQLPGGVRLGHRDLRRYYKQRYAPEDSRDSVIIQRLVTQYKALGHTDVTLPSETVRRKATSKHSRLLQDQSFKWGYKANKIMLLKPQIMF